MGSCERWAYKVMEYEEIKELNRSEKSVVHLVRDKGRGTIFVRKILKGRHGVYKTLQGCPHPFLPKLYEVTVSDESTTVIEEYIEGEIPDAGEMSDRQLRCMVRELCTVLEFLHGKGIIHRDIKPSHVLLAGDGHIRLIDFDAARMPKEALEQDTRLLGTKGYAPPEQYGFAQTDERADIYALGVTLGQLLGEKAKKQIYKRIIRKCTRLDPDKRYQSVRQVRQALSQTRGAVLCGGLILLLIAFLWQMSPQFLEKRGEPTESAGLQPLPAPENPRWDGETGIGIWNMASDSGLTEREVVKYRWKLCRKDTAEPPTLEEDVWVREDAMRGNAWKYVDGVPTFAHNFSMEFWEDGFYYFAVAIAGDGVSCADSPYVISDAFVYTGEDAPPLPVPTGLEWRMTDEYGWVFFATWDNLDDYENKDSFDVTVYNKNGEYVTNNIWTKEDIVENGHGGIRIRSEFFAPEGEAYRFTVQAMTSRPNEYKSSPMPDPVPEEYFSPWMYY